MRPVKQDRIDMSLVRWNVWGLRQVGADCPVVGQLDIKCLKRGPNRIRYRIAHVLGTWYGTCLA